MQNPNEDTQWNDVLREKGILPAKSKEKEFTEDEIVNMVENVAQKHLKSAGKISFSDFGHEFSIYFLISVFFREFFNFDFEINC